VLYPGNNGENHFGHSGKRQIDWLVRAHAKAVRKSRENNTLGKIMKKTCLLALLATTTPFAAQAESITGGVTLSYTQMSEDSSDIDTTGLDGRLALEMDNGLTFGVDLGHSTMSPDGAPFDLTAEFYSVEVGYRFANGFKAGVFADRLTMGAGAFPVEITLKTDGVSVGYEGNGFETEAFVGQTSVNIPMILPPGIDIENYGITGHYTGMEGLDVGAAFLRARLSDGAMSEDMDFVGLAATYMVGESLMVFGGASQLDFGPSDGVDSMGLGVSYDLGSKTGFASSVSFEYAQVSLDGTDADVMRLGLTIPLGKSGPVLPMNSVADAVLNARHGAFNAGMTAGF
jgi:hypothetical protein